MVSIAVQLDTDRRTRTPAPAVVPAPARPSSCDDALADGPWSMDAMPTAPPPPARYGPGSSNADPAPAATPVQQMIPEVYRTAGPDELDARVRAAKATLGTRLVVLGHHYQRDEVIAHADVVGDSYQLARAARETPAQHVVFCGVHFMAETADLLSRADQSVQLPNLAAGCSMADMADLASVTACWDQLTAVLGRAPDAPGPDGTVAVVPVTYMNSAADLKAFCGAHGGIVCTSSNAEAVLAWAFQRGERVLFFPDQHLGRNTATAMGVDPGAMPLWDPRAPLGGNDAATLRDAKVVLWRGWCSVHRRFTVAQVEAARAADPGVRVVVHPECPAPVVQAADDSGSTEKIQRVVAAAPAGSSFAIGTEVNMVRRLADAHPDLTITCLDPVICPCSTMYRIHPGYLAWTLEELVAGRVVNRVRVPEAIAGDARTALERMLEVAR